MYNRKDTHCPWQAILAHVLGKHKLLFQNMVYPENIWKYLNKPTWRNFRWNVACIDKTIADVTGLSNLRMDPCMMLFMKEDLVFCLYPGGIISYLISVKTEIRIGTYKKHSFHFTKNHVAWCRKGKNSFVGRMYRLISDSAQTRCYLFMGFWGNMFI